MNSFVKIMTTSIKKSENIKLREKKKKKNTGEKCGGFGPRIPSDEPRGSSTTENAVIYRTKLALGREPKTRHSGAPKHTNIRNLKKKSK